jgi:hypothetical protein
MDGIGNGTSRAAAEAAAAVARVRGFHKEYTSPDHRKRMAQYGLAALRLRAELLAQRLGMRAGTRRDQLGRMPAQMRALCVRPFWQPFQRVRALRAAG